MIHFWVFVGAILMFAGCSGGQQTSAIVTNVAKVTNVVAEVAASQRAKPNILILMAEDMSARVGAFGDKVALTPNIDALAQTSVRYPNTFTTAGVCAPSRAAHITGMHQVSIGAQHMRTRSFMPTPYRAVPPADVKAYPELLRHAGYYTFTNHKLDYQFSNANAGTGPFTIWDYEGKSPDWNRKGEGQPFYGLINLNITHESQLFSDNVKENRATGLANVVRAEQVDVPPYYPDTPAVRGTIAQHYDNIHQMDKEVGEILAKLKADGLADNTIVIWTTDHGDGLPRAKREIYDSGIKVPMVIHWPENLRQDSYRPGTIDSRLISFVDFAPSVLKMAGIDVPDFMQGKTTLLAGSKPRKYIYAAKDRLDEFPFRERAVRDHRYKYIYNYHAGRAGAQHIGYRDKLAMMGDLWTFHRDGRMNEQQAFWFEPRPQEELYDVTTDPHEVNNLVADPAFVDELARMRVAFNDWQSRVADLSEQPEAAMALSYWPNGKQPVTAAPSIIAQHGSSVQISSTVEGAALGYRIDKGPWQAYAPSSVVVVPKGAVLSAKAVRYGWLESSEVQWRF